MGGLPDGFRAVRDSPTRDRAAAGNIVAATIGVLVLAAGAAAGQRLLIGNMASQRLATIPPAGVGVIAAPFPAPLATRSVALARPVAAVPPPPPPAFRLAGLVPCL